MMVNVLYFLLAMLGLSFLIFVHELGHYVMARRVGMRVEVFSIGFGPPLRRWTVSGVRWQLSLLPFGGYVKIAGMERKEGAHLPPIANGFYAKKPIDRIKVALAGPMANVVLSFLVFSVIWLCGGQERPFQQCTQIVGYVDPDSFWHREGVQPGDAIVSMNQRKIDGYQELFASWMTQEGSALMGGYRFDAESAKQYPFFLQVPASVIASTRGSSSIGITPAQYLIFEQYSSPAAPIGKSGIEKNDRVVWVDGEQIFSQKQLSSVLNESRVLLTIEREGSKQVIPVPRVKIADVQMEEIEKNELDDWQHGAGIMEKVLQLYFIPYRLSYQGVVQEPLSFLNQAAEEVRPDLSHGSSSLSLQPGDRILAVNGKEVANGPEALVQMQKREALVIVQRGQAPSISSWKTADAAFLHLVDFASLRELVGSIGSSDSVTQRGDLVLLSPVPLKSLAELDLDPVIRAQIQLEYDYRKKRIEQIDHPQLREEQLSLLEKEQKRLILGAHLRDQVVYYNPSPTTLCATAFRQTWKAFTSLVSGSVSPKALSGPVGIIQVLQYSWALGIKEALFWLGFVSLNLAVVNLLPLPILDGGHILFAAIESVTKKPIKPATMEKMFAPFFLLLAGLFIYLTYHDILRLLAKWW